MYVERKENKYPQCYNLRKQMNHHNIDSIPLRPLYFHEYHLGQQIFHNIYNRTSLCHNHRLVVLHPVLLLGFHKNKHLFHNQNVSNNYRHLLNVYYYHNKISLLTMNCLCQKLFYILHMYKEVLSMV